MHLKIIHNKVNEDQNEIKFPMDHRYTFLHVTWKRLTEKGFHFLLPVYFPITCHLTFLNLISSSSSSPQWIYCFTWNLWHYSTVKWVSNTRNKVLFILNHCSNYPPGCVWSLWFRSVTICPTLHSPVIEKIHGSWPSHLKLQPPRVQWEVH